MAAALARVQAEGAEVDVAAHPPVPAISPVPSASPKIRIFRICWFIPFLTLLLDRVNYDGSFLSIG
jgi:hypothetical protein